MTEDLEDEKKSLNKDTTEINRGVELLLRRRRKPEKPKTFQVKFGNMIAFFKERLFFTLIFTWTSEKNNSLEECHVRNISSNLDTYDISVYPCINSRRYGRMDGKTAFI